MNTPKPPKQQMNMFKINKQMEEIKKVIESHENKTKDIPDDVKTK